MDIINLLIFLAVGALVGWLAGVIVKGKGLGLIGNMIIGIVGAILGGVVFDTVGITAETGVGTFVMAIIGAVILLLLIGGIKQIFGGSK